MNHTETTLQNNAHNYIDRETIDDIVMLVLDCMQQTFGEKSLGIIDECSLSDIVIIRNEFKNRARFEPEIRHIFIKREMSLV